MALKPTIYKFRIALSDMDRDYYDSLNLTVAQHPSETLERMMARILAYCLNAQLDLALTKGLSTADEPDIWVRTPDEQTSLWIEIGEPDPERIKKATRLADEVKVYSFNTKSSVWYQQAKSKLEQLNVQVYQFDWSHITDLASLVDRTMDLSVTIADQSAYIATAKGECQIPWEELQRR
ncbi:YaeQ family protein [Aliiglaciecola litoralis]|uniref:YaeQ family protein n=1 Tax=Aliiglaciecola litoralis TaxID=582857 RepID=A0ABN1LCY4_9ALTE